MKIVVIGANGGTGTELVRQLLKKKHKVVAFVRDAASIDIKDKNLSIVKGNVKDLDSLKTATKNADAVVSALGPRGLKKSTLQEKFAENIVAAMQHNNVSRLVSLSAWGAGESNKHAPILMKLIFWTILRNVFKDKRTAESIIAASKLNYTLVRPGRLLDSGPRKTVKVSMKKKPRVSKAMSRADVAAFMIDQIDSDKYSRKSPIIGY